MLLLQLTCECVRYSLKEPCSNTTPACDVSTLL